MKSTGKWITLCAALTLSVLGSFLLIRPGAHAQPFLQYGSQAGISHPDSQYSILASARAPQDTPIATPTCEAAWGIVSSPNVGTGPNFLWGVTAVSSNDVWAVGYSTAASRRTLAEHWDGTQWSVVSSSNVGTADNELISVTALSTNNVWAVGYYTNVSNGLRQNLTLHWDGQQWNTVTSPNALGYDLLFGVSAVSTNDVWAVGLACTGDCFNGSQVHSLTMHWNGTQWSLVQSPDANWETYIWDVSAVSTNDVWAVGWSNGCPGCVGYTTTLHWNGTQWSIVPSPSPGASTNSFYGVKAISSNNVWATGHYYTGSIWRTLTEHWDGTQWSVVSSPNVAGDNALVGKVSATSGSDVWTVGYAGNPQQTLVLHWNGSAWSIVPSANISGQNNQLKAVASVSTNDVWAVGLAGNQTLVEHYTGDCSPATTSTPTPTQNSYTSTPASTPTCVAGWNIVSSPSVGSGPNSLRRVAVIPPNSIWAAGHYYSASTGSLQTLFEHWNGTQWTVVPSPNASTGDNISYDIKAISDSDIWAAGYYVSAGVKHTLTLHYDGSQWSIVPSGDAPGYSYIYGVAAVTSNDVWMVGFSCPGDCSAGSIPSHTLTEHWNGTSWSIVPSPNTDTNSALASVAAISANDVWATGIHNSCYGCASQTLTMHWNGTAWTIVPSPSAGSSTNGVYDTAAISANDVWFVGDYYAGVWRTLTLHWNGTQWTVVPSPNLGSGDNHLYGIGARASNDVWATGSTGNPEQTLTLHWDGTAWSVVPSANVAGQNNRLNQAEVSANDVWAVGAVGNQTLVENYTGNCSPATGTPAPTNTPIPPTITPITGDAFAHFAPAGPVTVMVGDKFTLDLMVNSGSSNVNAAQSYMTFTNSIIQNVSASQPGCVLTSTASPDALVFDVVLQNEICNGPNPCNFRGVTISPGSIAYASGALANPSAHGDFRVARIAFCASAVGDAVIHWQFAPPAPITRDSQVRDEANNAVSNRNLYVDYVVHVTSPNVFVGHVSWQGRPAQPHALRQLPVTLTLKSGTNEVNYPALNTDASGFFTVSVAGLANGTYSWRVKGPKFLANGGTVSLTGAARTSVEMGFMRSGDANNDNVITGLDFNIVKGSFGRSPGEQTYDDRADLDGDHVVSASDFNLMRNNFGQGGVPPTIPR